MLAEPARTFNLRKCHGTAINPTYPGHRKKGVSPEDGARYSLSPLSEAKRSDFLGYGIRQKMGQSQYTIADQA
ncbi:MAG: hypothetical protein V4468_17725 [Pseudomonadota bacterium]